MDKGPTFLSLHAVPGGRSVSESSGGPNASKSNCAGRNPGRDDSFGTTLWFLLKHFVSACVNVLALRYDVF